MTAEFDRSSVNLAGVNPRPVVAQPPNVHVLVDADTAVDDRDEHATPYRTAAAKTTRLVVDMRWFTPGVLLLVAFCVIWDAGLVGWFSDASRRTTEAFGPWIHVVIGVVVTYQTLCALVNHSRITVANGRLSVVHIPLPWRAPRPIAVEDLRQLYCDEVRGSKGSRTYRLRALLRNGETATLLARLRTPAHARFIEQLVESRLGIADERVGGEFVG